MLNDAFFRRVDANRQQPKAKTIDTAIVYSVHPIKGFETALRYCESIGVAPHVIRDCTPEQVLDTFERTRRFIYLPYGLEPAGRMLVEARFLGCEVVSNDNAGVCGEPWWELPFEQALESARDAATRFWQIVDSCAVRPAIIDPVSSHALGLLRGKEIAHRFNRRLAQLQRWVLPRRTLDAADAGLTRRAMDGRVVATGEVKPAD